MSPRMKSFLTGGLYLAIALIVSLWVSYAQAGYSVSVTQATSPHGLYVLKPMSGCYLTVSMAVSAQSQGNGGITQIDSINMTAGTWHAYSTAYPTNTFGGDVAYCTTLAQGGTTASVMAGVTDPGFVEGGGVSTGGGGGGSSSGSATLTPFTQEQFETMGINATDILLVMTWGAGLVLFFHMLGFAVGVAVKTIKQV